MQDLHLKNLNKIHFDEEKQSFYIKNRRRESRRGRNLPHADGLEVSTFLFRRSRCKGRRRVEENVDTMDCCVNNEQYKYIYEGLLGI